MMLTLIIVCAFIIWFSSVWIAVLSLMSFIGGWNTLSRLYPPAISEKNNISAKYPFSSIKMGIVSYRSCINISFTGNGIILEAMKIFSIGHKPVFIPYNKIQGAQKGKAFSTYITFTIENKKITIFGKAGEKLFSRLSSGDTTEKNITTHY